MSKTLDEKQQFIELRAKGYSFQKISDELKISKPTLIEWSKNTHTSRDIQNYRTLSMTYKNATPLPDGIAYRCLASFSKEPSKS
jgi:orotate phosphoribosyltransferase-like protein